MSAPWNLNTKHRRDLQPPSQKSFICPMPIFLNKKTLLRHEICGLIQTDTRMVGEEDRDRGLMNTQRLHPLVFANHPLRRNGIKLVDLLHSTLKEH